MKSYDKTLTRLILILQKLSDDERPTVKELAEEFGVGVRTIQRDLYERLAYFPIEKKSEEKLCFIDGFSLGKSALQKDEMLLVYLALSQVKGVSKKFEEKIDDVFAKLFLPTFQTPYYIKSQSFQKIDPDKKLIKEIGTCIEERYIATIKLHSNKEFVVEPYKIVSFSGIWYLFAKEQSSEKIRSFLLSTIKTITPTSSKYKLTKNIDEILENVHSAWFDDGSSFSVTAYVAKEAAYFFKLKQVLPTQEILKQNSDGSIIVTFEVSHYEDIDNIIKAWLPHIEVIHPKEYKEQIEAELQHYLENLKLNKENSLEMA